MRIKVKKFILFIIKLRSRLSSWHKYYAGNSISLCIRQTTGN